MGLEVLQSLIVRHCLQFLSVLREERIVGILENDCGLLLEFEHAEVLNVSSHHGGSFSHWAFVSYSTVSHGCSIGHSSISGAHVLLEIFLKAGHFLIGLGFGDFFLDAFWDEFAEYELWFLFGGL